jgi:DNA (cytosine-5)-methyltransferase 1
MGKYSCEKCAKSFSQKSHYDKHLTRKNPCEIQTDNIKALIEKAVDEKLFELNKKLISNNTESNITINITEQMDISKMSKLELLEKCKELGITKCNSKNKSQIIELINSKQKIPECELKTEVETNNICQTQNMIISTDDTFDTTQKHTYTFIEVCAGGGGLSAGLIKSGFTPVLLNDNNIDCCKTLKHNHPDANVVCGSMDKIHYSQYVDKVDLLTGGVPCQSFSQAGLRKGLDDPRGDLMLKFIEILNLIKPKIFMIENVKGLLTHDDGKTIAKIIDSLNKNKLYNISYKCLDSSKYDVPQKRERVFIVGVLKSINHSFEFPVESLTKKVLKDVLYNVPLSNGAKYNEVKIKLFKMIPQGGCWVNLPENLQKEYLGNSYNSGGGKRGILYRLSMEKPSLTLLCTPSQKQTERCHPLEERPLTIREYARIQTFDDSYEFIGSLNSQYKQIGNAVPVELAKYMGNSLLKLL